MQNKSHVAHTCFGIISEHDLEEIVALSSEDITVKKFRNAKHDFVKWRCLTRVLLYHPSLIARHEAAFVIAQLQVPGSAGYLRKVVQFDKSIVCKHEAIEALGNLRGDEAIEAYVFLRKLEVGFYDRDLCHPDVQATVHEAIPKLERELRAKKLTTNWHVQKYFSTI